MPTFTFNATVEGDFIGIQTSFTPFNYIFSHSESILERNGQAHGPTDTEKSYNNNALGTDSHATRDKN